MSTELPAFGPTEVFPSDENSTPLVVVWVAMELSLDDLRAALGLSHAELGGEPPLADMPVRDVRREVEGYLAAQATLALYRDVVATVGQAVTNGSLPAIDAAIERAYSPWNPGPDVQRPVYGPGRVELDTLDRGRVTVPEPRWCAGHDGEQVVDFVDVTHVGATVAGEFAGEEFLPARISWSPFAELRPEPFPLADVDEFPGMSPDELRELAAEVGLHAGRLYSKANELDRIRRETQ